MIIYVIENKVNGKKYVGQHCGRKDARWKQHLNEALKKMNPKPLYSAIRKYGVDNFLYKVVEELDRNITQEFLDEREKFFVQHFDTYIANGKGYNLTLGGGGNMVTYCSTDRSERISQSLDNTDFAAYNPSTGELIDVYDRLTNNYNIPAIRRSAKDINNKMTGSYKVVDEYIWLTGPEGFNFPDSIKVINTVVQKKKAPRTYYTEIGQFTLSGFLVKVWDEPPYNVANEMGISYQSLLKALKGDQRVVGGYIWRRFSKEDSPDQIEGVVQRHVVQFSKRQLTNFPIFKIVNGREVMRYPSVMDAIIESNLPPTQILNSLEKGEKDSEGAMWKWIKRPSHIRHFLK